MQSIYTCIHIICTYFYLIVDRGAGWGLSISDLWPNSLLISDLEGKFILIIDLGDITVYRFRVDGLAIWENLY